MFNFMLIDYLLEAIVGNNEKEAFLSSHVAHKIYSWWHNAMEAISFRITGILRVESTSQFPYI